ncbi:hypothetical protein BHE74_00013590, partial [Ensete ventricosum]
PPLCGLAVGRRCPYGLAASKQLLAGWPLAAGDASTHRRPSCWRHAHSRPPACWLLPLRVAAPYRGPGRSRLALVADLAVGGRPCMGGWPWPVAPPRRENTARTRRTILYAGRPREERDRSHRIRRPLADPKSSQPSV